MQNPKRFTRVNTCKECRQFSAACQDGKACNPIRQENLRDYDGIRLTADGFDCALPVTIDSHSVCSFGCLYCFSDNILQHYTASKKHRVGQTSLKKIENIFSGVPGKFNDRIRQALRYDKRNAQGYPCAVQLGGVCDAGDNIERNQGWLLEFLDIAIKYNQPVRMSTKGNLFLLPEYLEKMREAPHLFWVAFSLITPDDKVLQRVDKGAPNATERIESMENLTRIGVKTSLRLRPMIPGITDRTLRHPYAVQELIHKCADAGVSAVSAEVAFMPQLRGEGRKKWEQLSRVSRLPLIELYKSFGHQACTRPPYTWTEDIMHVVQEEAHKYGLPLGVSDPVWKQLTDSGCCCGILPKDPVFGNWEPENATNALMLARDTGRPICLQDIVPEWSKHTPKGDLCSPGAGPLIKYGKKHDMWSDKLREDWNNTGSERGPLNYFQGALQPIEKDSNGNVVYKYVGLSRQHKKTCWKV